MKNQVIKISSFSFLLITLMPVLFTLFFLYKQQMIRHEMKERLEEEMLHTIILSTSAVQWVKYKKEIRVDGKMFDIKSFTIINENYIFTGLYDEEETKLNNYLEKHSNQKNDTENNVLSSLFKMLHSLYANEAREELTQGRFTRSYSPLILQHTSSPFRNILTPPPQL